MPGMSNFRSQQSPMKNLTVILMLFICSQTQSQPNFFERTYGLGRGMFIDKALNDNFIIGASTGTYPYFQGYYFLIDGNGDTIRTMNDPIPDVTCIRQTSDGGFIYTGDSCCDFTTVVNKTDSAGNILWHHFYPSTSWATFAASVIPNPENGYFVAFVDDGDGPENSYIILKTDSSGNTLDSIVINTSVYSWIQNYPELTTDSGLIVAHQRDQSFVLTKLDKNDQLQWEKFFYDTNLVYGIMCSSAIQTNDGNYFIAGSENINMGDYPKYGYMLKADANGDSL